MTLRETESILETLQKRHPGLTEEMLVTLLRAGGWEERQIEEAKMVFRGMNQPASLPPLQENKVFQTPSDFDHRLLSKNEEVVEVEPAPEKEESVPTIQAEPQSLVAQAVETKAIREDLPHNLPLRPFETSEHIWPFSRYKDIFYGDSEEVAPEAAPVAKKEEMVSSNIPSAPVSVHVEEKPKVIVQEKIVERVVEKIVPAPSVSTPYAVEEDHSPGDEKLVIMACVMLLAVLLLLGYMYSNGRL